MPGLPGEEEAEEMRKKKKKPNKFVCDCGMSKPHGSEDCPYYARMAQSIRDALEEQRYERDRRAEDERWERLKL